jgi:hypothetical protein
MYLQKRISVKTYRKTEFFVGVLKVIDERAGSASRSASGSASGSVSPKYGSEDLDLHPNPNKIVTDIEH